MNVFKKVLIIAGISMPSAVFCQDFKKSDTLVNIPEVIISSSRINQFTLGNKIQKIEKNTLAINTSSSLTDVLSSNSLVQMNSYGTGALSSPSFRGTGSAHTAVLWNGFNLNDIFNSGTDFSHIPVFFLDDVYIQSGGCGALYGSGAVGGSINFNNELEFNSGINVSTMASIGSFLNHFEGFDIHVSKEKMVSRIRIFNHAIKNEFSFINHYQQGSPIQKMNHSETAQQGILINNSFKINTHQKLNVHVWLQNNNHNIPSLINDISISKQNEINEYYRPSIEWIYKNNKIENVFRSGLFISHKYYQNPLYDIHTAYHATSSVSEFENNYQINANFKLNSGINYTFEKGVSPDFEQAHIRHRSTVFSSLRYFSKNEKIKSVFSIREEMINKKVNPLTYSLGIAVRLFKPLELKANINKSFRVPSFNDLYWNDITWNMFGNPLLKNESGFNEEISLNYYYKKNNITFESGITGFNGNITDWIIWQPNEDYSKWIPQNLNTVWSRGIELNSGLTYNRENLSLKLSGMYTYMSTTNESKLENNPYLSNQLIYVPKEKILGNISVKYKKISVTYAQNYTGERYIDSENTTKLDDYSLANIIFAGEYGFKNYNISFNFHVNNIMNKSYEVIQYYPLPMRNYLIGIKINYKK